MDARWYAPLGCLAGFLAVALGAFAAHGLPGYLGLTDATTPERAEQIHKQIDRFETGARYHMYHALALVAVGLTAASRRAQDLGGPPAQSDLAWHIAGGAFFAGIVIFSGCLYAYGLTGIGTFGAIVPIGGVAFLVGWAALAYATSGLLRDGAAKQPPI